MADSKLVVLEGVRMRYRNFKGEKGKYNAAGQRSVALEVDPLMADDLTAKGFTIRETNPNPDYDDDDFEPVLYLPVKVRYDVRPPTIYLISDDVRTYIDEASVAILDSVDPDSVDAIVSPYDWELNGKTGTSAYLRELYVVITPSPLARKWGTIGQEAFVASIPEETTE